MLVGEREEKWQIVVYMLNPITAIVLVFQRALYARVDAPLSESRFEISSILPAWSMGGYAAYVFAVAAFAIALLFLALYVFGRLENNFAEEL
jgi:ABC-2 type transport system permease protein